MPRSATNSKLLLQYRTMLTELDAKNTIKEQRNEELLNLSREEEACFERTCLLFSADMLEMKVHEFNKFLESHKEDQQPLAHKQHRKIESSGKKMAENDTEVFRLVIKLPARFRRTPPSMPVHHKLSFVVRTKPRISFLPRTITINNNVPRSARHNELVYSFRGSRVIASNQPVVPRSSKVAGTPAGARLEVTPKGSRKPFLVGSGKLR